MQELETVGQNDEPEREPGTGVSAVGSPTEPELEADPEQGGKEASRMFTYSFE